MSDDESPMVLRDEAMFFNIIQTTPDDVEAEDMLRRARTAVLREKAQAVELGVTRADQSLSMLLTRLNDELHYLSERRNRVHWRDAVKALFGESGYRQCCDYLAAKDAEARNSR